MSIRKKNVRKGRGKGEGVIKGAHEWNDFFLILLKTFPPKKSTLSLGLGAGEAKWCETI